MKPILLATALVLFAAPAFADHTTKHKQAQAAEPTLASPDSKQRRTPTAAVGGLLNTDVTPAQAKRVAQQTNRQIVRKSATNRTASNRPASKQPR